jgi:hypothetical protein
MQVSESRTKARLNAFRVLCLLSSCHHVETVSLDLSQAYEENRVSGVPGLASSTQFDFGFEDAPASFNIVALRYSIPLIKGSTVTSAIIQFASDTTLSGPLTLTVDAQKTANAPLGSSAKFDITNRTRTTTKVTWVPLGWLAGRASINEQTSNLGPLIQEVIGLSAWAANNNIMFIFTEAGPGTGYARRTRQALGSTLTITYTGMNSIRFDQDINSVS